MSPNCTLLEGINLPSTPEFSGVKIFDAKNELDITDRSPRILVSDQLEPAEVVKTMVQTSSSHLVQKNSRHFGEDLVKAGRFLIKPQDYFENPGACLLDSVEKKLMVVYSSSGEKPNLKKQSTDFVDLIQSQNVSESAEAIIEELYMNAIIDAPREAVKRGQKNKAYEKGLYSALRLHQGPDRLVISCEDPFGSLDTLRFLARMNEVYEKGAGNVINLRGDLGGAGLGCVIMFEHCESLMLGVMPGRKTLVSCVIPLGMSYRQRALMKKSLHLIFI